MNTKLSIAAIAMFAVIMGVGAIAPAIAAPGNPTSRATTEICHFAEEVLLLEDTDGDGIPDTPVMVDTDGDGILDSTVVLEPAHWKFLFVNNNGAVNGHLKHGEDVDGDGVVDNFDFKIVGDPTRDACNALVNPVA